MKLSFSTLGCPEWSLAEILSRAAEYGYDGIALRGIQRELDLPKVDDFAPAARAGTLRRVRAAGLEINMVLASARVMAPDAELAAHLQLAETHIDLASDLECPYVRVFGGPLLSGLSHVAAVRRAGERLRQLGERGARRGVQVLLETHDDWSATALLRRAMEAADHPNVGALWDVHHPARLLEEAVAGSWDTIGPWVRSVDVKDSVVDFDARLGYRYVQPGSGESPLAEALTILRAGGYDGWLSFEWEKMWHAELADPAIAFPAFTAWIRQAWDKARTPSRAG